MIKHENLLPDFPNYYVSENGEIFSNKRGKWVELKPNKIARGNVLYSRIGLMNRFKKRIDKGVHRWVLIAHVGESDLQCRHLDGNAQNNHISNLKYGTARENNDDKVLHGTISRGEDGNSKLKSVDIPKIFDLYLSGLSQPKIAKIMGVSSTIISLIIKRKLWGHIEIDNEILLKISEKIKSNRGNYSKKIFITYDKFVEIFVLYKSNISASGISKKVKINEDYVLKVLKREMCKDFSLPDELSDVRYIKYRRSLSEKILDNPS